MSSYPLFPKLTPKLIDPAWFGMDKSFDEDAEVTQLEQEHQKWLSSIAQRYSNVTPIGKSASENLEEDEEEDDEDDNEDDEESESLDGDDEDEIEMDMSQAESNSPMVGM
ncbi:anaphase-promoting complex subunit 15-like [Onthophagus taurus]|uniref:anaphase-promoting complex subunit 15-like n=1 Tax=Onthophagus taurus TaxID=166361 RepID=UPI000C209E6F|nr:anaphase-promoting complex subunit 15-like [Onthophagus taurus]